VIRKQTFSHPGNCLWIISRYKCEAKEKSQYVTEAFQEMTDMANPAKGRRARPAPETTAGQLAPLRVVLIGDAPRQAFDKVADGTPVFLPVNEISAEALAVLNPDVVLAPLVATRFDCFDVAHALVEARFEGPFRAVVDYLPNPALVRREITACCPDLDFDIVVMAAPDDEGV